MSLPPGHRAAAALVLDGAPADPGDLPAVLNVLAANKVHLQALQGSPDPRVPEAWEALRATGPARAAVEAEARLAGGLLSAWREAEGRLEAAGIRSVLFKSPRWFPARSSNLDVLVPPGRFREAAGILEGMGHILFPHYREDHKLLFRTFRRGTPHLSVHLHEMVSWGKVVILHGDPVTARSLPGEGRGFRVSSPQDVMAVTVAHSVFETDQIRLNDLLVFREAAMAGATAMRLLDEAGAGFWQVAAAAGLRLYDEAAAAAGGSRLLEPAARERVDAILRRRAWAGRRVRALLAAGVTGFPWRLPKAFSKEHLLGHILADERREPSRRILDLASSAWSLAANRLRIRTLPPSLVSVSGIDGAGKSGAADAVTSALRLCEVPTSRIWTRGGFTGLASAAKAAARRAAPSAIPAADDEEGKSALMRSPWKRRLWIWATILEQAISLQRVRLLMALGRTVVADRYALDTLTDLAARLPPDLAEAALIRPGSLLLGATRTPDLALLIDLEADEAFRRKPDGGTLAARRRLAVACARTAAGLAVERLDGSQPEEAVAQQAVDRSVRLVLSRFPSAGGGAGR